MNKKLALLSLAVAAAAPTALNAQEGLSPDSADYCEAPEGWQEVSAIGPQYVVFGELHGTEQAPRFVGTLACALARQGERILVAIEQNAKDNAALQAAWALPASKFEDSLSKIGWAGRSDGVASEAMFQLLSNLHELKESGLPISIAAFNGPSNEEQYRRFAELPGQGPHEAMQAENIRNAAEQGEYDRVLVLVGNFHAQTASTDRNGRAFDPMARRLARYGNVVSLNMHYGEGTSWNCQPKPGVKFSPGVPIAKDNIACGANPTPGTSTYARKPFIQIGTATDQEIAPPYDGFYWVGPISASPPQMPGEEQ